MVELDVMLWSAIKPHIGRRAVASLLVMALLWLSTIGMLHHTDDFSRYQHYKVGQMVASALHAGVDTTDQCVAHKWMDASQFHNDAFVPPAPRLELIEAEPSRLASVLHLLPFTYTSLRAPPTHLS